MRSKKRWAAAAVAVWLCPATVLAAQASQGTAPLSRETITYESPVFIGSGESLYLEEVIERGGKQYHLVSARIKDAVREGTLTYASVSIPYTLEGRQEPPDTAWITLKDDMTGDEYEREIPRLETKEKDSFWTEEFTFSVSVSGYDAASFWLGETEIPADADLAAYGADFLEYLGLPDDCYQVEEIVWTGESYEKDGMLCRDAEAKGEKLVRNVEVKYGGQVRTPDVKGKQYIGIYEEAVSESKNQESEANSGETEETKAEISAGENPSALQAQTDGSGKNVFYWLRDHLTMVTVSVGFLLLLLAAGILLFLSEKEKKEQTKRD